MKATLRFFIPLLAIVGLIAGSTAAWGQVTIHSNSCAAATADWTFTNGAISGTTQPIQQSGYWLLDNTGDAIISQTFDVTNYSNLSLTFKVATYGSGTNHPCLVEYSSDGGSTWSATTFTSATPTSTTYISAGTWDIGTVNTSTFKLRWTAPAASVGKYVRLQSIVLSGISLISNDGDGTAMLTNAVGSGPLDTKDIFVRNATNQSVKISITGPGSAPLSKVSVTIPYQWNWTGNAADVAPAGDDQAALTGETVSGDGSLATPWVVSYTGTFTNTLSAKIAISNLTSPDPSTLTDNGNYSFIVKTANSTGTLTALTAGSPKAYVIIPLANVRNQSVGVPVLNTMTVATQGVATVASMVFHTTQMQSYIQDGNFGVNIFSYGAPPAIVEGTSYIIKGQVTQYVGNTEVIPAAYTDLITSGPSTMPAPVLVSVADLMASPETYEGRFIVVTNLDKITGTWPVAADATYSMTDDAGTSLLNVLLKASTDINENLEPTWPRDIQGIFYQTAATPTYALVPRYYTDIAAAYSLPVELTTFKASVNGNRVILNWKTATEVNNCGFEIQKSVNGIWNKIGFVEGAGTSNTAKQYTFTDKAAAGKYSYRLKQIDRDGKSVYSPIVETTVALTVGDYTLGQNYPNPFNPATEIRFAVHASERAVVKVYNAIGQEVATLFDQVAQADVPYTVSFDARDLSSGMYFYSLRTSNRNEIKKMILMK